MPQLPLITIPPSGGAKVALQLVAIELKPDPVNAKIEPTVPVLGVTLTLAVTLKKACSPSGMSFAGVPRTVTFQLMFVVAYGPTTKVPVATPELMVHVEEANSRVLGVTNTVHPVSTGLKPVPLNEIVAPLAALAGVNTSEAPTPVTVKVVWAESPPGLAVTVTT